MTVALYTHPDMFGHRPASGHPERPERLRAVLDALADSDLDLAPHEAGLVQDADLHRVHDPAYVKAIRDRSPGEGLVRLDADTWMSAGSFEAAQRAAGAVVQAVRDVANGQTQRAFCAVRPPGHHAEPGSAMGFCIFSSIAVAAHAALEAGFARVAVVDFDVHHGNGTQAAFEHDPTLFLASIYQRPLYPGTGDPSETGVGNIVNGVVGPHSACEKWRKVFEGLMSHVDAFAPDIILISAGFDAHARDPLASQSLEAEDFAWATRAIVSVANGRSRGRVVSSLEGGYDLEALGRSALAHVQALQEG